MPIAYSPPPFSTHPLTPMPTHKHAVQCGAALDMQCIGSEALQLTQSSLEVGNNVMFKYLVWATRVELLVSYIFVLFR